MRAKRATSQKLFSKKCLRGLRRRSIAGKRERKKEKTIQITTTLQCSDTVHCSIFSRTMMLAGLVGTRTTKKHMDSRNFVVDKSLLFYYLEETT